MTDYKLVPIDPAPEMVEAAEDAYMPFGDMELAIRMALLAAPDHIADAGKMVSRQQIREVFLRNGFTIKPGCDDLREYVYKAAFELLELAAPAVQGEPVYLYRRRGLHDFVTCNHDRYAELSVKPHLFETKVLYTAPQPAGAALPPEITREMLGMIIDEVFGGGIEDASVIEDIYRVIARSATMQPAEQQPAPDVAGLVEALESLLRHAKKM